MGGLLPNGTMNIYKGTFRLAPEGRHDIAIGSPSLFLLFNPSNHLPFLGVIPAGWNDVIKSLFDNNLYTINQETNGKICVVKKAGIVTVVNKLDSYQNYSYLVISLTSV